MYGSGKEESQVFYKENTRHVLETTPNYGLNVKPTRSSLSLSPTQVRPYRPRTSPPFRFRSSLSLISGVTTPPTQPINVSTIPTD